MNNEILDALSQITREKSVDRTMLIETLEMGLASAVRKKYGATADVQVRFNDKSGTLECALRMTVVVTTKARCSGRKATGSDSGWMRATSTGSSGRR